MSGWFFSLFQFLRILFIIFSEMSLSEPRVVVVELVGSILLKKRIFCMLKER